MVNVIGRTEMVARLVATIAATGSPGRCLAITGPAGIGKTSVVDAVLSQVGNGTTILRCRGIDSETQVPFVGLSDLLAPIIERRGELPAAQARALAGAIAIDEPVSGEPLAVRQGALNLIRIVAADSRVVIFADDAAALDRDSRGCLDFIVRRVPDGVTVFTAARAAGIADDGDPRDPHLVVGPLAPSAARALVRERRAALDTTVLRSILRRANGNPLALSLMADALTDAQAAGLEPLPTPLLDSDALGSLCAAPVDAVAGDSALALLVAALSGTEDRSVISAALAALDLPSDAFVNAEAARAVRVSSDRITFTHPLIRERVVSVATDRDRRRAHEALASSGDGYTAAWHRAAIATGPDEVTAAALEAAGHEAVRRRALDAGVAAFRKADELTPDPERALDRLAHAIRWAVPAGHAELTVRLVGDGVRRGATGVRLAQLRLAEALAHHALDRPIDVDGLLADAEMIEPLAPMLASFLFTSASIDLSMRYRLGRARDIAERAIRLAPSGEGPAALAYAAALSGDRVTAGRIVDDARSAGGEAAATSLALMNVRVYLEDDHALLGEVERGLAAETFVSYSVPFAAAIAAEAAFRAGRWADCTRLLDLADDAADGVGAQRVITRTLVLRARLAAAEGDLALAHDLVDALAARIGNDAVSAVQAWHLGARGFVALTANDIDGCITALEPILDLVENGEWGEPTSVPWAADLVEAYCRRRRLSSARRVSAVLRRQAENTGSTGANAVSLRCEAMLSSDSSALFEHALRLHERARQPFETGRTHLAFGESLRRAHQRDEAAEHFTLAARVFGELGAAAWAEHATAALRSRARARPSARTTLTPAEAAVATHAAAGRTNREIASLLFVSAKTVETHLGAIYRKLGVRGRVELARCWPVTEHA